MTTSIDEHGHDTLRPERGLCEELMGRPVLNAAEVGYLLNATPEGVRYLHRMRLLQGVKVGKRLMWKPDTITRYLDALEPEGSA